MRIGLVIGLHDGGSGGDPAPRWDEIRDQVVAAEAAGFDLVVLEDALSFGGRGHWESISMAGAIAAATSRIGIAHSVINAPLRPPAVVARAAATLDEISGGRYTLGIGAGNTPDDYEAFGVPADPRFSRFAETMDVIDALLRDGAADHSGRFEIARIDRFEPRGPRSAGPPIVIAGAGPKMLDVCARLAEGWNWWADAVGRPDQIESLVADVDAACTAVDRDPATLARSIDVYSHDPLGITGDDRPAHVLAGSPERLATSLLSLAEFGIGEVRVDVVAHPGGGTDAVAAMAPVVELVHAG